MLMLEMTLEIADRAARGALAKAATMNIAMTVSVVDEAGRLIVTMRGDRTGFLTIDTSRAKAVAAAAFKRSTRQLVEMQKTNPAFWSAVPAVSRGEALPSTGAVPILMGGRVIGAIGCGGGTPDEDDECATAGAAAASG
jgi:glc operon protein GlcG